MWRTTIGRAEDFKQGLVRAQQSKDEVLIDRAVGVNGKGRKLHSHGKTPASSRKSKHREIRQAILRFFQSVRARAFVIDIKSNYQRFEATNSASSRPTMKVPSVCRIINSVSFCSLLPLLCGRH